jgi:hypothetical protein
MTAYLMYMQLNTTHRSLSILFNNIPSYPLSNTIISITDTHNRVVQVTGSKTLKNFLHNPIVMNCMYIGVAEGNICNLHGRVSTGTFFVSTGTKNVGRCTVGMVVSIPLLRKHRAHPGKVLLSASNVQSTHITQSKCHVLHKGIGLHRQTCAQECIRRRAKMLHRFQCKHTQSEKAIQYEP